MRIGTDFPRHYVISAEYFTAGNRRGVCSLAFVTCLRQARQGRECSTRRRVLRRYLTTLLNKDQRFLKKAASSGRAPRWCSPDLSKDKGQTIILPFRGRDPGSNPGRGMFSIALFSGVSLLHRPLYLPGQRIQRHHAGNHISGSQQYFLI